MDKKSSSKLYTKLKASKDHVLYDTCESWRSKLEIEIDSFSLSVILTQSFSMIGHLSYVHSVRALHNRFYTNLKLVKTGIKISNIC